MFLRIVPKHFCPFRLRSDFVRQGSGTARRTARAFENDPGGLKGKPCTAVMKERCADSGYNTLEPILSADRDELRVSAPYDSLASGMGRRDLHNIVDPHRSQTPGRAASLLSSNTILEQSPLVFPSLGILDQSTTF